MYRLAVRAPETNGSGASRAEIQTRLTHLAPGADLPKDLDLPRHDSERDELSQMRSVKLPKIIPGSASAEFFLLFGPGAKLEDSKFVSGSEKLKGAGKFIHAAVFPISYPEGSAAKILRRAILVCSEVSSCNMVLFTPDTVTTLN
jgi:hypothetical protein